MIQLSRNWCALNGWEIEPNVVHAHWPNCHVHVNSVHYIHVQSLWSFPRLPVLHCQYSIWSSLALSFCHIYCSLGEIVFTFLPFSLPGTGMASLVSLIFLILSWFIHICLIFYKIACPIWSLRTSRYNKWIHLCLLCVGKLIVTVLTSQTSYDHY